MTHDRNKKNSLISFVWLAAGFVSWYLSIYLFSYILSPFLIDVVRNTNAITQSALVKNLTNIFFAKAADFILCFLFALVLSFFTKSTKSRLFLFIFGMIAISLYIQVEGLINYLGTYSELPSWAMTSLIQGFVSILLIIPLMSVVGSKVGTYLKKRRTSA